MAQASAAYHRQWAADNPEKVAEKQRRWRAKNPEYHHLWRQRNRERVRASKRKTQMTRRARQLGQFIEDVDPQTVYTMHGGMCGICKQFIEGEFHVDHVIPLSKGGLHGYINVQPAHPVCNMRKGARV